MGELFNPNSQIASGWSSVPGEDMSMAATSAYPRCQVGPTSVESQIAPALVGAQTCIKMSKSEVTV